MITKTKRNTLTLISINPKNPHEVNEELCPVYLPLLRRKQFHLYSAPLSEELHSIGKVLTGICSPGSLTSKRMAFILPVMLLTKVFLKLPLEFCQLYTTTSFSLSIPPSPRTTTPKMIKSGRNSSAENQGFNEQNIPQLFNAKCLIINWRSVSLSFTGLRGRQKCFATIPELSLERVPTCLLTTDFLV